VYTYGNIEGSKPSGYPFKYSDPINLKTQDIDGCKVGSLKKMNQFTSPNNFYMDVRDIPGAVACSKKRGMTTGRVTNPLWPDYKFPGHSELKDKNYNPYGKTAYVEKTKYDDNNDNNLEKKGSKTTNNFYPM